MWFFESFVALLVFLGRNNNGCELQNQKWNSNVVCIRTWWWQ